LNRKGRFFKESEKKMLNWIVIVILLLTPSFQATPCTWTVKDIPYPSDPIIFGDPRKRPACFETSFEESRPKNLFNPDGLRFSSLYFYWG